MLKRIVGEGPTIIVVKERGGHVFGGFASEDWSPQAHFYGKFLFIRSFIHSENLYSAPSRSAPSPATAKEKRLERLVELRWMDHLQRTKLKWEVIPNGRTHNQKNMAMHDSQMSPWFQEPTPCSRAKHPTCSNIRHWAAEVAQVRWSTAKHTCETKAVMRYNIHWDIKATNATHHTCMFVYSLFFSLAFWWLCLKPTFCKF